MFIKQKIKDGQGLVTEYYDSGAVEPAQPVLVFIPGGVRHPFTDYGDFLAQAAKNFRLIIFEIPGFTNSFYPKKYPDCRALARFFNQALAAAGLRADLVSGHSLGGLIAALMAAEDSKIGRAVLVNSGGCPLQGGAKKLAFLMIYKTIRQGYLKKELTELAKGFYGKRRTKKQRKKRNGKSKKLSQKSKTGKGARELIFVLKAAAFALGRDYQEDLRQIKAKTVIVQADQDLVFGADCGSYLLDLIPDSAIIEVKGHHDWAMEEQLRLAQIIKKHYATS